MRAWQPDLGASRRLERVVTGAHSIQELQFCIHAEKLYEQIVRFGENRQRNDNGRPGTLQDAKDGFVMLAVRVVLPLIRARIED